MPEFIEIEGTTFNVRIVLTLNTTELDEIMDEFEVVAIAQSGEGDSGASKTFTLNCIAIDRVKISFLRINS